MAKITVIHDRVGKTLTVYFSEPDIEQVCEEVGEGVILIKDKNNRVIGFEKLYYEPSTPVDVLTVETSVTSPKES